MIWIPLKEALYLYTASWWQCVKLISISWGNWNGAHYENFIVFSLLPPLYISSSEKKIHLLIEFIALVWESLFKCLNVGTHPYKLFLFLSNIVKQQSGKCVSYNFDAVWLRWFYIAAERFGQSELWGMAGQNVSYVNEITQVRNSDSLRDTCAVFFAPSSAASQTFLDLCVEDNLL